MRHITILSLLLSLLLIPQAFAHKVVASGWTDGQDIEGEVGFSNGDMAKNGTIVEIYDLNDQKIGETAVTDDGLFRFTPSKAIPHKFVANLGAGHVAQFVMGVDELPEGLAKAGGTAPTSTPAATVQTAASSDIAQIVAKAVRKEVQPLRKEIASYKEKNDLQSILGGIGYILGLTGIVFYIMARRKEKNNT
ncbi:cobalt ABC transporter permease [Terasakiella sp. A23]|uniref:cobalt ABC transporter permease n=1 Tax=Terasakiella sp. FCG-A23 TaxID=3080561 RepID=UPI0029545D7E|nr:cobalt ABC transporter permease [Terasakiella sp. A23]MDV7339548.1 cobalt ABC transporter permease [Terasakiella sp. A23]